MVHKIGSKVDIRHLEVPPVDELLEMIANELLHLLWMSDAIPSSSYAGCASGLANAPANSFRKWAIRMVCRPTTSANTLSTSPPRPSV